MSRHPRTTARAVVLCALIAAGALGQHGCLGRARGGLEQLVVVQYRWNLDEERDIARVAGLVRNTGQKRTPPADVVVTLVGSSGSMKGQDRTELPALRGGEEREFYLEFTSHGKTSHVDIQIVPRGAEPAKADEQPAEGEDGNNG